MKSTTERKKGRRVRNSEIELKASRTMQCKCNMEKMMEKMKNKH
jgi:hypothetical protein